MNQETVNGLRIESNFNGTGRLVWAMHNQRSLLRNVAPFLQQSVDHQMFPAEHRRDLPGIYKLMVVYDQI